MMLCLNCNVLKDKSDFYSSKKCIECRNSCMKEYRKKYHEKNIDKIHKRTKEYYKKNADRILKYKKDYYENNPDKYFLKKEYNKVYMKKYNKYRKNKGKKEKELQEIIHKEALSTTQY